MVGGRCGGLLGAISNRRAQELPIRALAALSICTASPAFADVAAEHLLNDAWGLAIEGKITDSDARAVEGFLESHPSSMVVVFLNSAGGDALAGLSIGYQIRLHQAHTLIPEGMTCASACAFAYLGGVRRTLIGRLGLHRPYQAGGSVATDEYGSFLQHLREYIEEMNVSSRIFDVIRTTPPLEMAWFGPDRDDLTALRKLGLHGEDPIWIEAGESRAAAAYGISIKELFGRETLAEQECGAQSFREWSHCYSHVMVTGSLPGTGQSHRGPPIERQFALVPRPAHKPQREEPPAAQATAPRSHPCVWNASKHPYECSRSPEPQLKAETPISDPCVWNAKKYRYECW